jgi:hypothetical protein
LNDRERRHLDAARSCAGGDLRGASERLAVLSIEYPRDALALAVGHQLDFFCGDAQLLRDRIGRVLSAWDQSDPWFGFVLGMHAFGLEECGLYPRSETVGLRALERQPRDVWALHAVVHTYEMQGQVTTGLRFMDERRADWSQGNVFAVHNSWHEALYLLELEEIDRALAIYDSVVHNSESARVALEMLDASALLWRLYLDGVDVGDRWYDLADAWAEKSDEPWYVFNDMHAVMALVGAGRLGEARQAVTRLRSYVESSERSGVTNIAMTAAVGLPVCEAILAFGEGRYRDVTSTLHPIRTMIHRFGGSHAQRDAVARTMFEAAIRDGNDALAEALGSERLAVRESSAYTRRQLARIRRAEGHADGPADVEIADEVVRL